MQTTVRPLTDRTARLTLLAAWLAVLALLFRPAIHGFDPVGYYAWVRSVFIRGTLDVSETFAHYGLSGRALSPTGYLMNEWPVGSAVLWSPFFALGHLAALLGGALGLPWPADGYSLPYLAACGLGTALYALAGLQLLFGLCRRIAPPAAALAAVLTAWLAAPLVFYMSAHPFMAHTGDFFLTVVYLRLLLTGSGRPRRYLWLGLVCGLAACVRLQSATLMLWPLAELAWRCWQQRNTGLRPALGAALAGLGLLAFGATIGFLPQLVTWRVVFGRWVILNVYGMVGAGSFDLRSPHWLDVLVSTNRGLFLWHPAALLALWGILRHLTRAWRKAALVVLAQFMVQVYLIGSWSAWSGAAAFGQRFLVGLTPAWALGLAALYAAWRARGWKALPWAAGGLLTAWNLVLLARYALQDVPRVGYVEVGHLLGGQFTFLAGLAERAPEIIRGLMRIVM